MKPSNTLKIGITSGDPNGIGPEITAAALQKISPLTGVTYRVIADACVLDKFFSPCPPGVEMVSCDGTGLSRLRPGEMTPEGAKASLAYLRKAEDLLKNDEIQGLVTAPVCKESLSEIEPGFTGHTGWLADRFHVKDTGMMFVAGSKRVLLVTIHIPLKDVPAALTRDRVLRTVRLAHHSLISLFHIQRPRVAVCGLNPHAGEHGLIGQEETDIIEPALLEAKAEGILAEGPFPADTLFSPGNSSRFDVIIAMYHDQGLIPVKTVHFDTLVNLTVGLPFIRTSPAHGTAFSLAGKGSAQSSSMRAAIILARDLTSRQSPP